MRKKRYHRCAMCGIPNSDRALFCVKCNIRDRTGRPQNWHPVNICAIARRVRVSPSSIYYQIKRRGIEKALPMYGYTLKEAKAIPEFQHTDGVPV